MNTARPLKRVRSVNSNASGFPTWAATELDPPFTDAGTASGRSLIRLGTGMGGEVPPRLEIWPIGIGLENDTFDVRIVGFRRITPQLADERIQYARFQIARISVTLSQAVGLAGASVLDTERFADTITIGLEGTITADVTRMGNLRLYSPADNTPANVVIPTLGCDAIEFEFDQTLNTPTMNVLYALLDDDED